MRPRGTAGSRCGPPATSRPSAGSGITPPRPLGAAVNRTMLVRIDFAPCPIPAVPLRSFVLVAGLRRLPRDIGADAAAARAQHEDGPQAENCQSLLHPFP